MENPENQSSARSIAKLALSILAVKLWKQGVEMFKWKIGWKTPIYNDNRLHLGYVINYRAITSGLYKLIHQVGKMVDGVVGTSTAGIPWGALVAERLNKAFFIVKNGKPHICKNYFAPVTKKLEDMILNADIIATNCDGIPYGIILADRYEKGFMYVRNTGKDHGMKNQIEGPYKKGQKVLYLSTDGLHEEHCNLLAKEGLEVTSALLPNFELQEFDLKGLNLIMIEDLASTGKSYLDEVKVCRNAGATVENAFVVFSYEFPITFENAKNESITLHSLCNYDVLISVAIEEGYIDDEEFEILKEWRPDPKAWSDKYAGTNFTGKKAENMSELPGV